MTPHPVSHPLCLAVFQTDGSRRRDPQPCRGSMLTRCARRRRLPAVRPLATPRPHAFIPPPCMALVNPPRPAEVRWCPPSAHVIKIYRLTEKEKGTSGNAPLPAAIAPTIIKETANRTALHGSLRWQRHRLCRDGSYLLPTIRISLCTTLLQRRSTPAPAYYNFASPLLPLSVMTI